MSSSGVAARTRPEIDPYDPAAIEQKWQERWRERGTNSTDVRGAKRPFYGLMMFPYPSAEGLHVGNLFAFTGADVYGRFQRLQGKDVFEPLGYDAFGIHSENYALKVGEHPSRLIPRNIANFRRQLERAGLMVDWRYSLATTDPDYYKWTQWIFVQLFKHGLAYKKKSAVNWCPTDKTVLANEQVIAGACERCGSVVEQRMLEQWFFRISDYAGRLLSNLDRLDWSETTKTAQRNWIGKSEGAEISFPIQLDRESTERLARISGHGATRADLKALGAPRESISFDATLVIRVFTTRPDTIYGATYMVLAPEHPLVDVITPDERVGEITAYREQAARQDIVTRKTNREKTGVFTGAYATNPATRQPIPVWVADYVLMEYGTGAIMGVPGHDERDFEFARRFKLPIIRVVAADGEDAGTPLEQAFVDDEDGVLVNSGPFDMLPVSEGGKRIVDMLASAQAGRAVEIFRLHDWCISRQRYWGPPIPIIYCEKCGPVAVPEEQLPVVLPEVEDFKPDDTGVSPLARHESWYRVPCPKCGGDGRRETDVSDTFLDSAWYFLRYPSVGHDDAAFDPELTRKWLPVDSYIGGNEHAVLHMLYSRFITMVLQDAGFLEFEEPFTRFRAHGMIIREGAKMSKSRGNVVIPDAYIEQWGADTFRAYLMFLGPFEEGGDFRDSGISGVRRFIDRVWASAAECDDTGQPDQLVLRKLHQTIRKVGDDIPRLGYNTAIAAMMEYVNTLRRGERVPHRAEVEPLIPMMAPFAPHVAEELWERLGNSGSVFDSPWPHYDPELAAEDEIEIGVQVNGKTRGSVRIPPDADQKQALAAALADPNVARFVTGEPRKVIFVPGRLLNVVL